MDRKIPIFLKFWVGYQILLAIFGLVALPILFIKKVIVNSKVPLNVWQMYWIITYILSLGILYSFKKKRIIFFYLSYIFSITGIIIEIMELYLGGVSLNTFLFLLLDFIILFFLYKNRKFFNKQS